MEITVENIKCGGCAGSINKKLASTFNTKNIKVDIKKGIVSIDLDDGRKPEVVKILLGLGYPEVDSVRGIGSAKAKAKSFVSCAIGKINQ